MEFGTRLKEIRTSLNISQKELSEQAGLTLRTIQRIESNKVKPSRYSLKVISKIVNSDFSECAKSPDPIPYEINFNIKITNMNRLINDLKTLVKTHWKTILLLTLIVWLFTNYTEIKLGIVDAWSGK